MSKNNKKESRMNIEILSFLVGSEGKEFTAKQIEEGTRLGMSQTGAWLTKLRADIDANKGYTKGYSYRRIRNEISHQPMWVYKFQL